jgi:hypothetical protein
LQVLNKVKIMDKSVGLSEERIKKDKKSRNNLV